MLHTIDGNFTVYRELAEWCVETGVKGCFVVRMLDRVPNGDATAPVYIQYIAFEDAARGVIKHTMHENHETRIIGPTLLDITSDLELFYLRYRGLHGINAYREF